MTSSFTSCVLLLLVVASCSDAVMRCLECSEASSFEKCQNNGKFVQCINGQICGTHVLHHADGSIVINKGCAPPHQCPRASDGNPHRCEDDGDSCKCCCEKELCNGVVSDCEKSPIQQQQQQAADVPVSSLCDVIMTLEMEHGSVSCSGENNGGSRCEFTCDDGFILIGESTNRCSSNGSWVFDKPTCSSFDLNNYMMEYDNDYDNNAATTDTTTTTTTTPATTTATAPTTPTTTTAKAAKSASNHNSCSQHLPTTIENGAVKCTSRRWGDSCLFECDRNAILIGDTLVRCNQTTETGMIWSKPFPFCAPVPEKCIGKPVSFPHGKYKCSGMGLTEGCWFECDTDYELIGPQSLTCSLIDGRFQSSGKLPTCQALVANVCQPRPSTFKNINARCKGSGFGEICQFTCPNGGNLLGPSSVTCARRSRGELGWDSMIPTCNAVSKRDHSVQTCPPLAGELEHGELRCTGNSLYDVCFVGCEDGYQVQGVGFVTCQREYDGGLGWSDHVRSCVKNDAVATCYPVYSHIENGEVRCDVQEDGQQTCHFECHNNYSLHGPDAIYCEGNEQVGRSWSSEAPECLNVIMDTIDETNFRGVSCLQLPAAFRHGSIKCTGSDDSEVCTFECETDYYLVGVTVATCNRSTDGHVKWNADIPICSPIRPRTSCGDIIVENGEFSCQGKGIQQTCQYNCNEGYYASSPTTISCVRDDYGQMHWDSQAPFCLPAVRESCSPAMEEFSNGRVRCVGSGVGEVCEFTCEKYFNLMGETTIRCVENDDGEVAWSSLVPRCLTRDRDEATCVTEISAPENGRVLCECGPHRVGTVCLIACNHGYELIGEGTVICEMGRRKQPSWSYRTRTQCRRMGDAGSCPSQMIAHGEVTCSDDNNLHSECTFTCKGNYTIHPKNFVSNVCLNSGAYDAYPMCCEPICPPAVPGEMLIMIDVSSSTTSNNWWSYVKLIESFIRSLVLSDEDLRIAILPFADEAMSRNFVRFSTSSSEILGQLHHIRLQQKTSQLHVALAEVAEYFENLSPREEGGSPHQPKSLIVLTNHEADEEKLGQIGSAARELSKTMEVMAFGFGGQMEDTLQQITGQGSFAVLDHWDNVGRWTEEMLDIVGLRMCRSRKCSHDNHDHHGGVVLSNDLL